MKLSELVNRFDNIEKQALQNTANKLTKEQSDIFRDIMASYKSDRYTLLDAKSGLKCGSL